MWGWCDDEGALSASIRLLYSYLSQCDTAWEEVAANVEGESRPEWEIEG